MADIFRKKDVGQVMADAAAGHGDVEHGTGLKKSLGVRDLTAFGIAAIVGAGIFSTIGKASYDGGPGIILLFIFVAIACGFSAMCYAEFASLVPVSGSAYTYSYVAFGEIVAWIIGWDLLMEYAIGNVAVAISWSDYFTTMLEGFGLNLPAYITMDYWTAKDLGSEAAKLAWATAPAIGNFKFICDVPAAIIVIIITYITFRGISESKTSANFMVGLKLAVIFLVIALGSFYVKPDNWTNFLPNGLSGVLKGTAAVFFAYIGFDAISTTAEECKNPQRDLPRSMIYSLIICTVIYVLIALVLTGMVSYKELNVGDPVAFVFQRIGLDWIAGIIAVSAVIALASVLLVFQLGQPRIWMSMSRDGLLPSIFSRIHPRFKTPSFATILTGFVVGIPALFLNLNFVIDLTSVGTLFAFVLVCAGVLRLSLYPNPPQSKFKTPYINSRWIIPVLLILGLSLPFKYNSVNVTDFLENRKIRDRESMQERLTPQLSANIITYLQLKDVEFKILKDKPLIELKSIQEDRYIDAVRNQQIPFELKYSVGWTAFRHHFLTWLFYVVFILVTIVSFWKKLSLIPVLGLLSCSYLLSESGVSNWERFLAWLLIGFVVYFGYGYWHSKLARK